MVGDRRHDINGAHAVKMRGLGVRWVWQSGRTSGSHRDLGRRFGLAGDAVPYGILESDE
ncbi:hypothetical protein [Bradyrhizobium liaoningense]|uniref:hypothetical protein n=1 Tax=Bradyrhizobium liaoningense TaxID=43992 RepID=UPI001FEC052F|nr:hypothetical protein [Bradyrhizobium liaoningense]